MNILFVDLVVQCIILEITGQCIAPNNNFVMETVKIIRAIFLGGAVSFVAYIQYS